MKFQRLLAVLSAALILALTACGESASTADTEKNETSSSQSETTADSSESDSSTDSGNASDSESKADTSSDTDSSQAEEKQEDKDVLIKEETYAGNDLSEKITYSYDYDKASGHYFCTIKKESSSIQNPGTMQTSYVNKNEYDENMTLLATYNEAGQPTSKNELNENGKVSKHTQYTKAGAVQRYNVNEYNKDGNLTKVTYYDSKGTVQETYSYEYTNGKMTKERYESNGVVNENTLKYNEKGYVVKSENAGNKNRYIDYEYEYFDDGGYKSTVKSTLNGNVTTVVNTYDSNGNLVLNESPNGFVHKYYYGKLPK